MRAIGFFTCRLSRVLRNPPASLLATERVSSFDSAIIENACEFRRGFHTALLSGNMQGGIANTEFYNRKDKIQIAPSLMVTTPSRIFSSEAEGGANGSAGAGAETVKEIYDKILNSAVEKRTAPPNSWLWSLIAKCSTPEDIKLLFDILPKLRAFRLSNLRIHEDFNSALCRAVTKACVRVGAIDFGVKTLWKRNLYGLAPDIGCAHQLLLHAKEHNDVKLMVKVLKTVIKNLIPLQPGTADIVFRICCNADRWDLISKNGKRFVKAGVSLRQSSFDMWMEFAARKGEVESLWKIEKWRSEAMKKHSVSTGFSNAKGFLLEHKPENAAAVIQLLYETVSEAKKPSITVELQKLVSEWPLAVIKNQKDDDKKAFATALQTDVLELISALTRLGVKENVTMVRFSENEAISS